MSRAAAEGAEVVLLQELTLSPYFCIEADVDDALARFGEDLEDGPTATLAREMAREHGIAVHASLYERTAEGRGYNTAICVDADGRMLTRTRKTHIPEFPYYHEDRYFEPADEDAGVVTVAGAQLRVPDLLGPVVPGAGPCAVDGRGRGDRLPDGDRQRTQCDRRRDTQPMWQQMIAANGLANSTFMIAINRIGTEGPLTFYGSSFISDPYGRVLVVAPRDRPAVLVANLDLAQRAEALTFGMLYTRRPDRYGRLLRTTDLGRPTERPMTPAVD